MGETHFRTFKSIFEVFIDTYIFLKVLKTWIRRDNLWEHACDHKYPKQKRKVCVLNIYRKSIYWDRYLSR
jgi:hypothetical protein